MRFLSYCSLVGAGIIVALLVCEIVMRLTPPSRLSLNVNSVNRYIFDSLLGHIRPRGVKGRVVNSDYQNDVSYNSDGFFDYERARAKPANSFRILVVGDSYVEALQVPLEQSFSAQLEGFLNKEDSPQPRRRVEVIKAGMSGWGPAEEYLYLREYGQWFLPDLVIICFVPGNDVSNADIELEEGDAGYNEAYRPYLDPREDLFHLPASSARSKIERVGWRYWLIDHSLVMTVLQRRLAGIPIVAEFMLKIGFLSKGGFMAKHGVPVPYQVFDKFPDPSWERAWRTVERLFVMTQALLSSKGIPLVIVAATDRIQLYPSDWAEVLECYPQMKGKQWDLLSPNGRLNQIAQAHNIRFLDLYSTFSAWQREHPITRLHFLVDGHWTREGQELTASALSDYITARFLQGVALSEGK